MRRIKLLQSIDWPTVLMYIMLVTIGCITIYSVGYTEGHVSVFDLSQNHGKQMLWGAASLLIAIFVILIDSKLYMNFAYPGYGLILLLLLSLVVFGREVSGSRSWFEVGAIKIQPAEFAKFITCLVLAKYLSGFNISLKRIKGQLFSLSLIFTPAILIILQGDTGSALVYGAFILVLYRQGWPSHQLAFVVVTSIIVILALLMNKYILIASLFAIMVAAIIYFQKNIKTIVFLVACFIIASSFAYGTDYVFYNVLKPHQQIRINVFLGKTKDPHGAEYNVNQSKIAIGSGGLLGKGYLRGSQTRLKFIPQQSTDFIFCTVGEERGFVGSFILLGIFLSLLIRIIHIAERQRVSFARIYGYGVAAVLFIHLTINIGMTIGLTPVIGIPLPFISYGGSSLLAFTILLFILLKFDAERKTIMK